jgi:hypothetical protein
LIESKNTDPCPCGSGSEYGVCCGAYADPRLRDAAAFFADPDSGEVNFYNRHLLINQLQREAPRIAESFDQLVRQDFILISHVVAETAAIVHPELVRSLGDEGLRPTCLRLLVSALDSFCAAVQLAGSGYRRQYGVLSRHVVETLATVLHLLSDPVALEQFEAGQLKSSKSITVAKQVLPHFGNLYGMLSRTFVHIGRMHAAFEPLIAYSEDDQALEYILLDLKHSVWLLYVTAELTCLDTVAEARYWQEVTAARPEPNLHPDLRPIIFAPTAAGRRWLDWLTSDRNMPSRPQS